MVVHKGVQTVICQADKSCDLEVYTSETRLFSDVAKLTGGRIVKPEEVAALTSSTLILLPSGDVIYDNDYAIRDAAIAFNRDQHLVLYLA